MAKTYLQLKITSFKAYHGIFLFSSANRPLQDLTALKKYISIHLLELFLGNLRSVDVFIRFIEVSWEVLWSQRVRRTAEHDIRPISN